MIDRIRTLAIVQHTSSEYLGLIEDHLEGRRIRFRYYRPFTSGGTLPQAGQVGDGLILLGAGPWGAAPGPWQLPTLAAEVRLAEAALIAGTPVLGFGLGAWILCLAAGGSVASAGLQFELTTAVRLDPQALAGLLPERYPLVWYARDLPLLPADARVLARDEFDRPALFQCGPRAFGFTGHPGVKSAMIEDLIMEFPESPADPEARLRALRAAQPALEAALVPIMTGVVRCTGLMQESSPDVPSSGRRE